jgi:3-methyladenine DNA glycosylase AlkD
MIEANMNYLAELDFLRLRLGENADPARARSEKTYLKSDQQFYGVKVPTLRKMAKSWLKTQKQADISDIARLAGLLWDSEWHEERSLATMLLEYRAADLTLKQMPLIERMIHEATTWAHLDAIAAWIIGPLIDHDKQTLDYLPRWAKSANFWVRRTAILAQLPQFRRGVGDMDLFTQLVVTMFNEDKRWGKDERFFIRKAIGWTLREIAAKNPQFVFEFVLQYRDQMSGLTLREATRNLPEDFKARL